MEIRGKMAGEWRELNKVFSKVWRAENAALDIFKNKDKIWERERGWKYLVYMFMSSEHVWL